MGILQDQSIAVADNATKFSDISYGNGYPPFSTQAENAQNTTTEYGVDNGFAGFKYAPAGLGTLFGVLPSDNKEIGPVGANPSGAWATDQYLGSNNNARGLSTGSSILGQLALMLNKPQALANAGAGVSWGTSSEVDKFKSTFTQYKTANRSAYSDLANPTADGGFQSIASGGVWTGYSPLNRYESAARQAASLLTTVKLGDSIDWGDISDADDSGQIGFGDLFVYIDIASGIEAEHEVSRPVGITGGFGIKEMMRSAEYTGKVGTLDDDEAAALETYQGGTDVGQESPF